MNLLCGDSKQEASKIKALAEADAEREARVGIGRAIAIEEQVKAYGGPQYQVVQDVMTKFTSAIEKAQIDIVPKTVVNMGGNEQSSSVNAFELLLNLLISDKLGVKIGAEAPEENARVKGIKDSIMKSLEQNKVPDENTKTSGEESAK